MYNLVCIIGTRPDIIRTSILLKKLKAYKDINLTFIWTGQHYDDSLKGIFIDELGLFSPDIELNCTGPTIEQHWKLVKQLDELTIWDNVDACIFLGDTNAVIGAIVPYKKNIPIIHIEGGMRSFNPIMPEEQNRKLIDHMAIVNYVYHENYKTNLVREGICPTKIEVVGNTICDVLEEHRDDFWWPSQQFKTLQPHPPLENMQKKVGDYYLDKGGFALCTLHRDEHMKDIEKTIDILEQINDWCGRKDIVCILPTMPRLRKMVNENNLDNKLLSIGFVEPLGFFDFLQLERGALIEFTDSGTNQEVSSILGTPCVVIREVTERPETFDSNISVMTETRVSRAADFVVSRAKSKDYSLGDGKAAQKILDDLIKRLDRGFDFSPSSTDKFKARHHQTWT